jgi:hypothetical protein
MPAHFRYHVPEIVFNAFVSEMRRRCARELTSEKSSKGEAFAQLTLVSANRCKMFLRASG